LLSPKKVVKNDETLVRLHSQKYGLLWGFQVARLDLISTCSIQFSLLGQKADFAGLFLSVAR
jgi:hypothetical protein